MTDSRRPVPDGGPSYCSDCGSALDPDDSFCSDCGAGVDGSSDGEQATARRQFRTRVNGYLSDGWEVEYDAGDEVVLVDRKFGSGWVHLLLFLTTGGVGNCVYGWYKYERQAEEVVLRADGEDEPVGASDYGSVPGGQRHSTPVRQTGAAPTQRGAADDDASLSPYIAGIFLFLFGIYVIGTSLTQVPSLLFGIGVTLVALLVFPPIRERLRDRHPPTTFGPTRTTEERAVSDTDQLCSVCRGTVDEGVVREYEEEYVVAGFPLYTTEAGENWYCESCHRDRHQFDTGSDEIELETELS